MYLSVSDKAPETAAQSAVAQRAGAQSAKQPADAASKTQPSAPQQAAARSISSLVSAAGLPADKLSATIISFARFFSLPLKPEMLKHIRQQAFTMTPNACYSGPASGDSAFREALSLAASAAEGKGAELQPKGLDAYAKAIDPESRQDGGQGGRRGRRKKNDDDNASEEVSAIKTAPVSAGSLEKTALEAADKNPLLAVLNRLPGKDGKRWIVLPFDFCDKGREFKVSLRILLESGRTVSRAGCMALDIAIRGINEPQPSGECRVEPKVRGSLLESGSAVVNGGTEKRRLFVLEPANRLSVYMRPGIEPDQQAALARELSALLEIAPGRIFIKTKTEAFPFEADRGDGFLSSVDEAV